MVASSSAAVWMASSSAATMRSKPCSANCLASSNPMPLEAPVTAARLRVEGEVGFVMAIQASQCGHAACLAGSPVPEGCHRVQPGKGSEQMDDEPHFGDGEPFSLGLEEELFLVDVDDGRLVNDGPQVLDRLAELERGEIKNELHRSHVELITGVCTTVGEAVAELSELRRAVLATGVGVLAAGTHPTAVEGDSLTTERRRYKRIEHLLGD